MRKEWPLWDMKDFRIAERERNCALSNAARHDRNEDMKENMVCAQAHRPSGQQNGATMRAKPLTSTVRSMLSTEPTATEAINRQTTFVERQNSTMACVRSVGSQCA